MEIMDSIITKMQSLNEKYKIYDGSIIMLLNLNIRSTNGEFVLNCH
jgi:hypothetical protein